MAVKLKTTLIVAITMATLFGARSAETKPNFVVFFVDDMGYGDLQSFGAPTTTTPNIDAMAMEGVRFTQWYSAHAICTPSRAAMVTGRLPVRNGVCGTPTNGQAVFACDAKYGLPTNETTFGAALQTAGYRTMAIGKWHLGQQWEYMPFRHGFDQYYGVPYSVDMGFAYHNRSAESSFEENYYGCTPLPLVENETVIEQPVDFLSLNSKYTAKATQFLTRAAADAKPFLLYLAYGHVHTPQYAGKQFQGSSRRGVFGDSVMELDASVGELMGVMKSLDLDKNTLVFLSSDNGAPNAAQHAAPWLPLQAISGSNGPFLGEKTTTWEGGLRVPGIAFWPGTIKPGVSEDLVSTMDIFATLLDAARVALPSDRVMDSHSLLPVLTGTGNTTREASFFYRGCVLAAVRVREYKLHLTMVEPATQPPAWVFANATLPLLFQIEHDPSERFPLIAGQTPGIDVKMIVGQIMDVVAAHNKQLGTPPQGILGVGGGTEVCCDESKKCFCSPPPTWAEDIPFQSSP